MTWYDMIGACNICTMLPCSMQCFQTCESSWRTVCSYCERFQGSITKCFKQHLNAFDSCSLLLHLLDELLDDQFHVSKFSKCFVRLISWLGHFGGFSLILEDFSHFNIFQRTSNQRFSSTNQRFSTRGLPTSSASRVLGHGASPSCWWWSSVDQQLVEGLDVEKRHNEGFNDNESMSTTRQTTTVKLSLGILWNSIGSSWSSWFVERWIDPVSESLENSTNLTQQHLTESNRI